MKYIRRTFMNKANIKSMIPREQLTWLFAILFTEKELFQLLMNTGLFNEPNKIYSAPDHELYDKLTEGFYTQSQTYDVIVGHLSQRAEAAISRVGYMLVEEIKTFFKTPVSLMESGEFGDVVWALLNDTRDDVHAHGFHLMSTAYEAYKVPDEETNQTPQVTEYLGQPQSPITEVQVTQEQYTNQLNENLLKIDEQNSEIGRLEKAIDEIKAQQTAHQKKNKRLEQHCKFLIEENERLKNRIKTFQEKEEKLVVLQQENKSLHENAAQYADTSANLEKLDTEHKQLLTKYEDVNLQLNELNQFKASTESFLVELKLVEEAMFKENQALEQLKSEMKDQFELLEKSHETSRGALNKIRMTVQHIEIPNMELNAVTEKTSHNEHVGVFVDVQNMFYAAKDRFERRVDYIKLLDLIVGPRDLICAYAYIVQIPEIKQANFISLLEHNGYTIRSKDLRLRGDGSAKGDWDVGIAVDVVSMLGSLDVVILASGDGDFCPLAELIKQQQKRIEVVAFEHNTSMDLQAMADQFFPIGEELLM